jgi:hypothetical protein
MQLLPSQKNSLFDAIVKGGLSPVQFEYAEPEGTSGKDTLLTFKGTKFSFLFHTAIGGNRSVRFSPGSEKVEEGFEIDSWYHISALFQGWVVCLAREISQPDKWGAFLKAGRDLRWTISDEENSQFSYVEVQEIQASIQNAKAEISHLELSQEQLLLVQSKLDYIAEKATTLGRVDWKNLFIGTLIGTIVQLAVPPEMAKEIWSLFAFAFKKIILIALQ